MNQWKFIQPITLISLFFLLFCSFARAGWVEDVDGGTIIHIKLWEMPDPSDTGAYNQAEIAAMNEFVRNFPAIFQQRYRARYEAHPELYGKHNWSRVEIKLHPFSGIKVENLDNAILAIAGGVAPDVLYVNFMFSDTYIEQGFLYPLDQPQDQYLSSLTKEEVDFRIHPKLWPVIRRQKAGGAERVWMLPYGGALGKIIAYRKDLFEEAGIDFPQSDWNWDDFLRICKKLTNPEKGVYGVQLGNGKYESWWWMSFLWSAGGDCMRYDQGTKAWSCVFNSSQAVTALDFYTRLTTEPWLDKQGRKQFGYALKGPEGLEKWDRGEIAMQFQYIDEKLFTHINPDVTGLVPVPRGPTGIRGSEINSRMMGIFAGVSDPVVRDASWEYIRFYDSPQANRLKTRVLVEGGLGKFVNPAYLEKFGYSELLRFVPPSWSECYKIAIDNGRPEPYGKGSRIAYILMSEPIQEAEDMALKGRMPESASERQQVLQQLLTKAADKANVEMLGVITPQERTLRKITAAIALVISFVAFVWGIRKTGKVFSGSQVLQTEAPRRSWWRYRWAYLMLFPAVATVIFWQYVPLARGMIIAFQDYKIMGGSQWVWLDNFGNALWDPAWWSSVWNGLRYSFLIILLTFIPPVVLAVFLQEVPFGKVLFRVVFYLPAVITSLVIILLWRRFYEPSTYGVLNWVIMEIPAVVFLLAGVALLFLFFILARRLLYHRKSGAGLCAFVVGLIIMYTCYSIAQPALLQDGASIWTRLFGTLPQPYRWLTDPEKAMISCVIPMAWAGLGPGCLIYLAALKGIPDDLFEAADVDGAGFIDKLLFIVFPMMRPLLVISFVGVFIGAWFGSEANILAMTGGGADTEVAGLHIFYKAFIHGKFGPATAMAWMLGCMLIGFTVQQLQILSKLEFKAATAPKEA